MRELEGVAAVPEHQHRDLLAQGAQEYDQHSGLQFAETHALETNSCLGEIQVSHESSEGRVQVAADNQRGLDHLGGVKDQRHQNRAVQLGHVEPVLGGDARVGLDLLDRLLPLGHSPRRQLFLVNKQGLPVHLEERLVQDPVAFQLGEDRGQCQGQLCQD